MSSTQMSNELATKIPMAATVDLKLEVVVIPVSDWSAAYIVARERGRTPEEAAKDGALHMEGVH
jgi:hypothetical protein